MRRPVLAAIAVVFAIAIVAGVQWRSAQISHKAETLYRSALEERSPLDERVRQAREAVRLQPDNVTYRQLVGSLDAQRFVEAGELEQARETLIDAWALDRSNTELRAQLRTVNLMLFARDSRKAHVLHGREGPGGELDPEDLLP